MVGYSFQMLVPSVTRIECSTVSEPVTKSMLPLIELIRPSAKFGSDAAGLHRYRLGGEGGFRGERAECGGADDAGAAEDGGGEEPAAVMFLAIAGPSDQTVSTEQGRRPLERLAIALKAAGVRSMMRLVPQAEPQQVRSPQNRSVCGPQSAIRVPTRAPVHRLVV